jgi:sulfite exporter TauE/SafE
MELLAAIALGFLGSFHCIGMCGPIALALPVHNKPSFLKYTLIVVYNLGRMLSYSFFGLLAGLLGQGFILAGCQQALSIAIGVLLLISVILPFKNDLSGSSVLLKIKNRLTRAFSKGTRPSLFVIGILNGFLPCGLVYAGMAGAAATGNPLEGAIFMAIFGLGTVPMMILLPLIGNSISVSSRNKIRKATPVIVTIMALLLIARGMDLGIPYLSPKTDRSTQTMSCHQSSPDKSKWIKCTKPLPAGGSSHLQK